MLRHYFPKGTDFSKVKQKDVVCAPKLINNKSRKIIGYKSSSQLIIRKELIKSECPSRGLNAGRVQKQVDKIIN